MNRSEAHDVYEFGGYRLDPLRRVLSRADGRPITLKPKVFDTLLNLVEHAGELVDKTTLMAAIWPNLVVEENNLNKNVSVLRHVLGETPGDHRFIVTEPGRGFRFVADVRRVARLRAAEDTTAIGPTSLSSMGTAPSQPYVPRPDSASAIFFLGARKWRLLGATAVLAAGLLVAWTTAQLRVPAAGPEMRVDIVTPPTSDPVSLAVSPDGLRLAFVGQHDGRAMLFIRNLDGGAAQPLLGTEGARHPFWSPDARSVGFFAGGKLMRLDVRGGPPQTLADAAPGLGAAWGPEDIILYAPTAESPLFRVTASGGPPTPATELTRVRFPHFLPGGRRFVFHHAGEPPAARGIYLGSLDSPEATLLTASDTRAVYAPPGWLLFGRQGTLLAQRFDPARTAVGGEPVVVGDSIAYENVSGSAALAASATGVIAYRAAGSSRQLTWFDRAGNTLGTLWDVNGDVSNLQLSPDGSRVAVERDALGTTDIWILDAARTVRFTSANSSERFPLWSPDGSRIAFESLLTHSVALAQKPTNGVGEEVLFESSSVKILNDWSPDGRLVLYFEPTPGTGADLWVLPLEGDQQPFIFLQTEFSEFWGQFSPDGRWVAYQSDESGKTEVYIRPFPGPGAPIPISTDGGVYPRWAPNGEELYYVAPDGQLTAVALLVDGTTLSAGAPVALFQMRRIGGGLTVIGRGQQYDVAPDGRFLVNALAETGSPPITLLLNWRAPASE